MIMMDAKEERRVLRSCYDIHEKAARCDTTEQDEMGSCGSSSVYVQYVEGGRDVCNNHNNNNNNNNNGNESNEIEGKIIVEGEKSDDNQYYTFRRDISQVLIPGEQVAKVEMSDDITF